MPADAVDDNADRKETLASLVYDRMRRDIISLDVPPGEKLHIRSLCDRFEVGLSPVQHDCLLPGRVVVLDRLADGDLVHPGPSA